MASAKLFVFVQIEVPFPLGPPDGRYILRDTAREDPEQVLVLRSRDDRGCEATLIDAVPLSAEDQARAWLAGPTPRYSCEQAFATLNRVLAAQRVAAADHLLVRLAPHHARRVSVGWGTGEQVAGGHGSESREVDLLGPTPMPAGASPEEPAARPDTPPPG
ncbi:MAG: hypothetical protein ACYDA6_08895, partial [Solirubrobacteraceae bacterium]